MLPGFALHEELALLVEAGLTPMEALQAARGIRRVISVGEYGDGQVKKAADLVLLDANPLEDIHNTQKIEAAVMRGRYYSRKELNAMLRPLHSSQAEACATFGSGGGTDFESVIVSWAVHQR